MGREAAAVKADFSGMDQAAAEEVIGFATDALGGLDILVNNAGIIHREDSHATCRWRTGGASCP